jgi:ribosome-binding factor A
MQSPCFDRRAEARSLCADLYADDGPPERRRTESRDDRFDNRKTMQLCAQVKRALYGVIPLPGLSCFDGLVVEAVEPDPDASRLRVVIRVPASATSSIAALRNRLIEMVGFIRSEVAPQIHRKRVPSLTFTLKPREGDA